MKHLILCLCLLLNLCAKAQNTAALDAKNGFRDAILGSALSSFKELHFRSAGSAHKYYDRASDKLTLGNEKLKSVTYVFYKERLSEILIELDSAANTAAVLATLRQSYGAPTAKSEIGGGVVRGWQGKALLLMFKDAPKTATITYISEPLRKQEEADRVKAAKSDL